MTEPRFTKQMNVGFGFAIIDTAQNDRAVCWVDPGLYSDGSVADAIAAGLNATNPVLHLEHEEDEI